MKRTTLMPLRSRRFNFGNTATPSADARAGASRRTAARNRALTPRALAVAGFISLFGSGGCMGTFTE